MSTHQTQEEESFYLDNNKEKPLPQSYCNLRFLFLPVKSKGVGEKNTVLLPCCLDYNCVKGNQEKGILHKKTENRKPAILNKLHYRGIQPSPYTDINPKNTNRKQI